MSQTLQQPGADYLRDESRLQGSAEGLFLPENEAEVRAIAQEAGRRNIPLTIQGGRTGITGGAVPDGGWILNLSAMNRMTPVAGRPDLLVCEAGARLCDIRAATPQGYFFSPDPTETTASLGGMITCNASGALSYLYGPTRPHIQAIRVVLANGELLDLERGRDRAQGRHFQLGGIEGVLPEIPLPAVKNAAGYYTAPDMDLLDLFIGSEGTLGIVTSATVKLLPAPPIIWGLLAFPTDSPAAAACVQDIRAAFANRRDGARVAAMEYFDPRAMDVLRGNEHATATAIIRQSGIPEHGAGLYLEFHGADEAEAGATLETAIECLAAHGVEPDACILADSPAAIEKLKAFRHALPEYINGLIDERRREHPGLTKLGTDMSVPDACLPEVLALYERDLTAAGLEYAIFGHIGDNHLHVNILPRNPADYEKGKQLYRRWAEYVAANGGSISAEHGIGKLKRELFADWLGPERLEAVRQLKRLFDPQTLLNSGNLFR